MKRFSGKAGKAVVRDALRQQKTLACCEPAILRLAQASDVVEYPANSSLIIQDSDDNRLAFVLSGRWPAAIVVVPLCGFVWSTFIRPARRRRQYRAIAERPQWEISSD